GWWHGKTAGAVVHEFLDQGPWEILIRVFVKFLAFLPLFAVWEIGRALGDGKLFELFFTRRVCASVSPCFGAAPATADVASHDTGRPAIHS
ncbi:MAG TPA: hypothetical protein VFE62_22515, partial [Gemmataceae bacterium]|nr:hypothetical protein [Gemmataceae bacterium]